MCQKLIYPVRIETCSDWNDQSVYTFQFRKKKPTKEIEQLQNAILSRSGKRIVPKSLERIESYDKDGNLQADTMQCLVSNTYFKVYNLYQEVCKRLPGVISFARYAMTMCEKAMNREQLEESLINDEVDVPVAYIFDGEDSALLRKIVFVYGNSASMRFFERHHQDGLFGGWTYNDDHILCYNGIPIWEAMEQER